MSASIRWLSSDNEFIEQLQGFFKLQAGVKIACKIAKTKILLGEVHV